MKKTRWNLWLLLMCAGICMLSITACTGGNGDASQTDAKTTRSEPTSTEASDSFAGGSGASNDLPILWE